MINFIPLKQSEDLLTMPNNAIGKMAQPQGSFKDIFKTVASKSELNTDNHSGKNEVDKKESSFNTKKVDKDLPSSAFQKSDVETQVSNIEEKLKEVLNDENLNPEEMDNIVVMIMNLMKIIEEQNVQLENDGFDLKKIMGGLREKLELLNSKLNGDFIKPKTIEAINEVIDKIKISEAKIVDKDVKIKNFKDFFEANLKIKNEEKNLSHKETETLIKVDVLDETDLATDLIRDKKDDKGVDFQKRFNVEFLNVENGDGGQVKNEVKHLEVKDVKDIIKIVDTIEMAKTQGVKKLTVQLHPENLGKLEIQLVESGGKINAKIFTDNEQARFLLANNIDQMRNQLQNKGIHIENMEFSFTLAGEDKGKQQGKESKSGFKFGGSIVEEVAESKEVEGLYA
ncbi:MAG: flagellar hook-length control protein FliK [Calditerrivibrio sp.]|uniref:flagellar hook-length control protein FliK n=1 Tax=Calditerrivibrio sp. TaxID=2792612 RepID=UPI003D126F3C